MRYGPVTCDKCEADFFDRQKLNKIGLLLCHSHIRLRLKLTMRLIWGCGWDEGKIEVEIIWKWSTIEVEFRLSFVEVEFRLNYERKAAFIGLELWLKTFFKSTYIAEQHLFSMFPSIFTFYFDSIYGSFWIFRVQIGLLE